MKSLVFPKFTLENPSISSSKIYNYCRTITRIFQSTNGSDMFTDYCFDESIRIIIYFRFYHNVAKWHERGQSEISLIHTIYLFWPIMYSKYCTVHTHIRHVLYCTTTSTSIRTVHLSYSYLLVCVKHLFMNIRVYDRIYVHILKISHLRVLLIVSYIYRVSRK